MRLWELEEGDEGEAALGRRANERAVERVRDDDARAGAVMDDVLGLGNGAGGQAGGNALGPGWRQFVQAADRGRIADWDDDRFAGDMLEEELIALMI